MEKNKLAYLIGIKGVGMTALAIYLKQAGFEVTGSDKDEVFVTDKLLKENKIKYFNGFGLKNLKGLKPDLVVSSAAYDEDNLEFKEAKKRHLTIKYYSEILGQISSDKKVIAVSGIHGKTTTTAIISYLLQKGNFSPSFIIGVGKISGLKSNSHKGDGEYFVIEADEYRKSPGSSQPKFLDFTPFIAVISSIELDHPDMFDSLEDVYEAFYHFVCRIPRDGTIVLCIDYPKNKKIRQSIADRNFETYGFGTEAKWKIVNIQENDKGTTFYLDEKGDIHGPFKIKLFGKHNVLNATAAIITGLVADMSEESIKKNISQFSGVERRFEKVAEIGKLKIFDDYAHHPTAIEYTLETAKKIYPNSKVLVVFQPHTFSRTERLLSEFGKAFKNADKVVITDIFSSAREKNGKITANDLVEEVKKNRSGVRFIQDRSKIMDFISDSIKGETVLITMGAGDIYTIAKELPEYLKGRVRG